MAQRLAELCSILVENAYGDLAAQIFSTLAEYGRLSLIALRQISGIPPRRLKAGLTTLIQHHIILHHTAEENLITYYQVDWQATYVLIRIPKILRLVKSREGEAAGQLISNILQLGHASVGDLEEEYGLTSASKRDSGIETSEERSTENGLANGSVKETKFLDKITTLSEFHKILRHLLAKGLLVKVTERTYLPAADLQDRLRDTVIKQQFPDGKITGSKKEKLFQHAVNNLKRKWQEDDSYSQIRDIGSHGQIKRAKISQPGKKKSKTADRCNGVTRHDSIEHEEAQRPLDKLPDDLVVKVNFAKFNSLFRTEQMVQMVHNFLGPATAAVYAALLQALESNGKAAIRPTELNDEGSEDEEEEKPLPSATDVEVYEHLDKDVDLGLQHKPAKVVSKHPNGIKKHRHKNHVILDEDDIADSGNPVDVHSDAEHEDDIDHDASIKDHKERLHQIGMHLDILAEHPKRFCIRNTDSSKTKIDFATMAKTLIGIQLETMIDARMGEIPIRFVRILRQRGKVDEQELAEMTMLPLKKASAWLTSLQFAGLAHGQELPKDGTHQTGRAVHLWWFDEESVRSSYLERTYQGMSRALQRLRFERETHFKAAIEKAERADVKGREQELLNLQDREELRKWQDVEDLLLVQVSRLDDLVAVLRDFSGEDTSFMT